MDSRDYRDKLVRSGKDKGEAKPEVKKTGKAKKTAGA